MISINDKPKPIKAKSNILAPRGLLLLAVTLIPSFVMAQDPGPCPDCPIDGGTALLMAAGLLYGLMKNKSGPKPHN